MAIKRMDEVLASIAAGKSNTEIRDEIDGRIGDRAINQLRKKAMQTRQEAEEVMMATASAQQEAPAVAAAEVAAPAEPEGEVPFVPEPEETVPEEEPEDEGPQLPECVTAMLEETDPPMSVAEAIRELARYVMTDDVDHLIEAALAINARMDKEKRRIKRR